MFQFLKRQAQRPLHRRVSLHNQAGYSLLELLFSFVVLAAILAIMVPTYYRFIGSSRVSATISELNGLQTEVVAFNLSEERYPDNLAETDTEITTDRFGNPYRYYRHDSGFGLEREIFGLPLNDDFDVYSMGPDGLTAQQIDDPDSLDDILRASNGRFFGLAEQF